MSKQTLVIIFAMLHKNIKDSIGEIFLEKKITSKMFSIKQIILHFIKLILEKNWTVYSL